MAISSENPAAAVNPPALADVRPLTPQQRLGAKETLGLYLTGHPIEAYEEEIRRFASTRIVDLGLTAMCR